MTNRESVRVCKWCRCEVVQLPDTRWRSIHGKSVYCAGSEHPKKFHEPLAEPAEPEDNPTSEWVKREGFDKLNNIAGISTEEVKYLRDCYAKDLRTEKQASPSVRDSMRKIIAVCDEVLKSRESALAAVGNPRIGAELAGITRLDSVPPLSSSEQPPVTQFQAIADVKFTEELCVKNGVDIAINSPNTFGTHGVDGSVNAITPTRQSQRLKRCVALSISGEE